jgi:hypothetical protein
MRTCRFLQLAVLSLLVGCAALTYAQDEKKQDAQAPDAKPEMKQDDAKPQPEAAKPTKEEKKQEKEDKKATPDQSHDQAMPAGHDNMHPAAQGGNMHSAQAGTAGKGGHIPDDKFKAHFGRGHTFTAKTVIVSGQPQFNYGGYTFELVDAWPVGWAYTDDCYIDFIDGQYFLFDLLHPGVQVAIIVVL